MSNYINNYRMLYKYWVDRHPSQLQIGFQHQKASLKTYTRSDVSKYVSQKAKVVLKTKQLFNISWCIERCLQTSLETLKSAACVNKQWYETCLNGYCRISRSIRTPRTNYIEHAAKAYDMIYSNHCFETCRQSVVYRTTLQNSTLSVRAKSTQSQQ